MTTRQSMIAEMKRREEENHENEKITWKDGVLIAGLTALAVGVWYLTKDLEKYPEERRRPKHD